MSVFPVGDLSASKQVTVALVGYGYWGPKLARCISKCGNARFSAICELSPERADAARAEHPNVPIVQFDDILNDSRVEAVVIATPTDSHAGLAFRCLGKGKHVLVEKPFTSSVSEAKALVEESRRVGTILMVDYTYLFSPAFEQICELVTRRNLGTLRYYHSSRLNCFGPTHETNVLWDLAVHDLSMLDVLMPSPPASVQALGLRTRHSPSEAHAQLTLRYTDRAIASVSVSWVAPVKTRTVILGFDRHSILWDDLAPGSGVKLFHRGVEPRPEAGLHHPEEAECVEVTMAEPLSNAVSHFLDCIRSGARPRSDVRCGIRTNQIMEAADRSISIGGLPIALDAGVIAA